MQHLHQVESFAPAGEHIGADGTVAGELAIPQRSGRDRPATARRQPGSRQNHVVRLRATYHALSTIPGPTTAVNALAEAHAGTPFRSVCRLHQRPLPTSAPSLGALSRNWWVPERKIKKVAVVRHCAPP